MRLILLFLACFTFISTHAQGLTEDALLCAEKGRHQKIMAFRANPNVYHGYEILYHRCHFQLNPLKDDSLIGKIHSMFRVFKNTDSIGFDLVAGLQVDSVKRGNTLLDFSRKNNVLYCHKPGKWQAGSTDSVTVFYRGKPSNGGGFGYFVRDNHMTGPIIHTLSEPYGAKFWWPCKQTLDDKIDSIDIYIKTHKSQKAASNGLLISSKIEDTMVTYHWKHRYPIATYLVAMAVTNYNEFTDYAKFHNRPDSLPVLNYVFPETLAEAKVNAREVLPMLRLFDSLFGDYPFKNEKYGHAQFNWGGGMEHQTMSFMVNFSFDLMAHELAHQWFGDQVTCGSLEDLWLNEGFATYLNALCYDYLYPHDRFLDKMWWVRRAATNQPGGSVRARDTTNVQELFNGNLRYNKAAFLLHMLRDKVGDSIFFQTVRQYLASKPFSYGFAVTSQFKSLFEQNCNCTLDTLFNEFYEGEGFPYLYIQWLQVGKNVHVEVKQKGSSPNSPFFHIKVPLLFKNKSGEKELMTLYPQKPFQTFDFQIGIQADTVSFDPNMVVMARDSIYGQNLESGKDAFSIGPNPVREELSIYKMGFGFDKYLIYSESGQLVKSMESNPDKAVFGSQKIDMAGIPAGMYVLKIINENFVSLYKLIKY